MDTRTTELFEAYECGVNYGLYLAEMERISEGFFDAAQCYVYSQKMCRPSAPAQRRQPRSEEWQKVMGSGFMQFIKLIARVNAQQRCGKLCERGEFLS